MEANPRTRQRRVSRQPALKQTFRQGGNRIVSELGTSSDLTSLNKFDLEKLLSNWRMFYVTEDQASTIEPQK